MWFCSAGAARTKKDAWADPCIFYCEVKALREGLVDGSDGFVEIVIVYAYDDVEL